MAEQKKSLQIEVDVMKKIAGEFETLTPEGQSRVVNWLTSVIGKEVLLGDESSSGLGSGKKDDNKKSIKNIWETKNPTTNYQKLAVLGYYLEFNTSQQEFNLDDLSKLWREGAREALPTKQVLINAINACVSKYHYLVPGSKKSYYRMGARGQKLVEKLPNAPENLLGTVRTRRTSKRRNRAEAGK